MEAQPGGPASAPPRIRDAAEMLGGALRSPAFADGRGAPGGRDDRTFLGAVFLEAGDVGTGAAGRLVLAPTLDPSQPGFAVRLEELRAGGAAGVIIKHPTRDLPSLSPELSDLVLVLDADADWADTAQTIRALASGDSGLVASGIRQGDLFALANTIASLAGGAVSLVDTAGRIVGYSTHADQPIDALRRATTLSLRETEHPRSDEHFQQLATSATALSFPGKGRQYGRVAVPVRSAGELLGTAWVVQVEDRGAAGTRRLLDSVEPLIAHHMLRARDIALTDERRSTDLLRALFEDTKSRRAAAARLGLDPSTAHTVVGFRLRGESGPNPVLGAQQLVHQASTTARGQFAWSHCAILDGVIIALLGSSDQDLVRVFAERIVQSSSGAAVAGIGRTAASQTQIPRSYRDAVAICGLLTASDPRPEPRSVAAFTDVRAELGIMRVTELLQDSELLEGDDAERLLAHDRAQQSQLAPTLRSVLAHQGSIRAAALDLHIHQNTVRYRLETVRTELGIDLDHAPTRLWLWLRLQ